MKLSLLQKKHLDTVRWLLNDSDNSNWRTGRSTLMAWVFIEKAVQLRSFWVQVYDHTRHPMADKQLLTLIEEICEKEGFENVEFNLTDNKFRIKK